MVNRRASLFFADLYPTPPHSIAEPEPSILGQEIAPDSACVKALPLALALPLHLCWARRYEETGGGQGIEPAEFIAPFFLLKNGPKFPKSRYGLRDGSILG